jgi:hypothetical protein
MTKQECVQQLSAPCFWDTDRQTFDMDQYPAFIVSRVFEIGTLNDWRLLVSYYGLDRIVDVCKQLRNLDPVSLSFITAVSDTNPTDYRCYISRQ